MADVTPHEWLGPRLATLVKQAQEAGIARDVSVAVITDLINGPDYSAGTVTDDENWNKDIGEPDYMVNQDATMAEGAPASGGAALERHLEHFPLRQRGNNRY